MENKSKQILTKTELEKVGRVLKTSEAKGRALYDWAVQSMGEKKTDTDFSDIRFAKRLSVDFPDNFKEGVEYAVELAFNDGRFRVGLAIAERGGLAEKISEIIINTPVIEKGVSVHELPESFYEIPGVKQFLPDEKSYYSKLKGNDWQISAWFKGLHESIVGSYLIPNKKHKGAIKELLKLKRRQEAFSIASDHFTIYELAKLAKTQSYGFDIVSDIARNKGKIELAHILDDSYVISFINGSYAELGNKHNRFRHALSYASSKGFSEKRIGELKELCASKLVDDFQGEIREWRYNLDQARGNKQRDRLNSEERTRNYDWEQRLLSERTPFGIRPCEKLREFIEFLEEIPKEKAEAAKKRLYEGDITSWDGFGVAMALGDREKAISFGYHCITYRGDTHLKNNADDVAHTIVENNLISDDKEKQKEFIRLFYKPNSSESLYNIMKKAAEFSKRFSLEDWLIEDLQKIYPQCAAIAANSLGRKKEAKTISVGNEDYRSAREYTEDNVEKAGFWFLEAAKDIEQNFKFHVMLPNSSLKSYHTESEVRALVNGLDLRGKSKDLTSDYQEAARKVIKNSFAAKKYLMGILFAKESGLTKKAYADLVTPETVNEAEKNQDFQSCFYFACLQGRKEDAKGYKALIKQSGKSLYRSITYLTPQVNYFRKRLQPKTENVPAEIEGIPF